MEPLYPYTSGEILSGRILPALHQRDHNRSHEAPKPLSPFSHHICIMTIQQRHIFFAALAALILISLITVPAAALAPPGGIQVYSTPTSAYACVDGGNCQYTPATFDGLTSNTYHTVTIYLSGYQTYTENVL